MHFFLKYEINLTLEKPFSFKKNKFKSLDYFFIIISLEIHNFNKWSLQKLRKWRNYHSFSIEKFSIL